MDFIDLKAQYACIEDDVNRRIKKVLEHGRYILGPEVQELEEQLAEFVGVKHCIGVSSGTDALLISLMALEIQPDDEIITSAFSFIATAEVIALLGAKPVFVDINPRTYNIDPDKLNEAITENTKAIIPVSLYGQCADFDEVNKIAKEHNIPVIEDAAQSFGATYKSQRSCALSLIGVTSFFPSKPLGCYGDAGAIFTDDDELANIFKQLRIHGEDRRYHHVRIGVNGRLDTIQAAVLLAKLEIFTDEIELKNQIAKRYEELLDNSVVIPYIEPHNKSVYAQYTIMVDNRDFLVNEMNKNELPTAIHYPMPLSDQPIFSKIRSNCKTAKYISERVLSLPMHPYLVESDQRLITDVVNNYIG